MALPTYNGTPTIADNAAAGTWPGTAPTGTTTGELLFAAIGARTASAITASPAGWNYINDVLVGTTAHLWGYWKIAVSGDVAGTTYNWTGPSVANVIVISRISGINTSTPIDTSAVAVDGVAGVTHACPTINTLGSDRLILRLAQAASTSLTGTVPSPATEQFDSASGTATSAKWIYGATEPLSTQGATGTRDITTGSIQAITMTIAIAPAEVPRVRLAPDGIAYQSRFSPALVLSDLQVNPDL